METNLLKTLDWEVISQPVLYKHQGILLESSNHFHLSKNSGQPLSVMGKGYVPMTVEDFLESTVNLSELSGYTLEGFQEFKEGRTILSILKNPELQSHATIPADDYIVIGSSFDGSRPFFIGSSTTLIRCQNQFSQIAIFDKVKHTKSSPFKREQLYKYFTAYLNEKSQTFSNFEKMDLVPVTETGRGEYARYVLNVLPKTELNAITKNRLDVLKNCMETEMAAVGKNVFGMFQGVTRFTTHELKSKDESFGNIFGSKSAYNQRAYSKALELVA